MKQGREGGKERKVVGPGRKERRKEGENGEGGRKHRRIEKAERKK